MKCTIISGIEFIGTNREAHGFTVLNEFCSEKFTIEKSYLPLYSYTAVIANYTLLCVHVTVCVYVCVRLCVYVCVHVRAYVCAYVMYVCVCMCVYICVYAHMHVHMYMHTCKHATIHATTNSSCSFAKFIQND